jgi:hypothetical protein
MSKTHIDFQKKICLYLSCKKTLMGKINDEAYSLVDITLLKTLDEETSISQNSYKEKSVI